MKRPCVFCGSSPGFDPVFAEAARAMGTAIARRGMGLVYGGGHVGLMGIVADTVLAAGGAVTGVIPRALADLEVAHEGLTELLITSSMHTRKAMMADLADGFIAMPGGIGTLEELFEIWTWAQLGDHAKPIALLNVAGFYDPLLAFLESIVAAGFFRRQHMGLLIVGDAPDTLLDAMQDYHPPQMDKWIGRDER